MAPDPHTVARAADGPWNLDALTTRLAELGGWRGPEEIGWTAAALVGRWRRRPRLAPERLGTRGGVAGQAAGRSW